MVYVTAPDRQSAQRIARTVLEARLAACVNLAPIESLYWWRGSLERAKELLLVFKTRRLRVPQLMAAVKAVHPYETPCIVTYRMDDGFPPYLAWIDRETRAHR
jgi:periplasmic divalent cation tolerance protein